MPRPRTLVLAALPLALVAYLLRSRRPRRQRVATDGGSSVGPADRAARREPLLSQSVAFPRENGSEALPVEERVARRRSERAAGR